MRNELTVEVVRQMLHYDPITGIFMRTQPGRGRRVGFKYLKKSCYGYIRIRLLGRTYLAHRLAWLYVYGHWPSGMLDHRNRIRDDNRIENLREADSVENGLNRKLNRNNSTGFRGVYTTVSGKWQTYIRIDGKSRYLGTFETPELAYEFRQLAEDLTNPEFYPRKQPKDFDTPKSA